MIDNDRLAIHFDYLSFTFPLNVNKDLMDIHVKSILENLAIMLGFELGEIFEQSKKYNNYLMNYQFGEYVFFRYGGELTRMKETIIDEYGNEKEIYSDSAQLEIKGSGCRDIEQRGRIDYIELFDYIIYELNGTCRRIDIAIDDKAGDFVTIPYITELINKHSYVSPFRQDPVMLGSNDTGHTIQFGTRSSSSMLVIYDKKAERRVRNDTFNGTYWTRFEMRFLKDKANAVSFHLLDTHMKDIGIFAREQLFQLLDLKIPEVKDKNRSRWKTDLNWLNFLDCVKGKSLSLDNKKVSTIESKMTWRDYSMTRMTLLFDLADSYNKLDDWTNPSIARCYHEMKHIVEYYKKKSFSSSDLAALNDFRIRNNKSIYSLEDLNLKIEEIDKAAEELKERYCLPF